MPTLSARREWLILLVLAGMQFLHIVDFMLIMPLGPQFMRLFHIAPQDFSWLVSAYTLAAAVVGFIGGLVLDRHDRRQALLCILAGFALATLCCGLASDYAGLLVARAAAGAFGGVMSALSFAIIGDLIPEHRRGRATGLVMSAFSVAAVAGVPFGLMLANHWHWRMPFWVLGVASLCLLLLALRILPPMTGHMQTERSLGTLALVRYMFSVPQHLLAFAFTASLVCAGFTVIPFLSPYMVATVGVAEADLPYVYLCGGLATLFTSRLIGRWADVYGKQRVFIWLASLSIIPVWLVTHLPAVPLWQALVCSTLFMVLVSGRFVPAQALVTSVVLPQYRGSFMSFNGAVQQLASGGAALLSGAIMTKTSEGSLIHFDRIGWISLAATLLCLWLVRKLHVAS
jgi:predicted MFS family arabinose efflux permease